MMKTIFNGPVKMVLCKPVVWRCCFQACSRGI